MFGTAITFMNYEIELYESLKEEIYLLYLSFLIMCYLLLY